MRYIDLIIQAIFALCMLAQLCFHISGTTTYGDVLMLMAITTIWQTVSNVIVGSAKNFESKHAISEHNYFLILFGFIGAWIPLAAAYSTNALSLGVLQAWLYMGILPIAFSVFKAAYTINEEIKTPVQQNQQYQQQQFQQYQQYQFQQQQNQQQFQNQQTTNHGQYR
jgi:hypothetical protein